MALSGLQILLPLCHAGLRRLILVRVMGSIRYVRQSQLLKRARAFLLFIFFFLTKMRITPSTTGERWINLYSHAAAES